MFVAFSDKRLRFARSLAIMCVAFGDKKVPFL
jgi:hypothetical protein